VHDVILAHLRGETLGKGRSIGATRAQS